MACVVTEKSREKLTSSDVRAILDEELVCAQKIPNLTKIDISKIQFAPNSPMMAICTAINNQSEFLSAKDKVNQHLLQSIQELLLEIAQKIEGIPVKKESAPEKEEPKRLSREQYWEQKRKPLLEKIKKVQKDYPDLAKNAKALAAICDSSESTLQKYMDQGLI